MNKFVGMYNIRALRPGDINFLRKSYKLGIYYGHALFKEMPKDIFMLNYEKVADEIILSGKAVIRVACLLDDPDTIIGYSIMSNNDETLIWIYVKDKWRKHGIGTSLIPKNPKVVTNLTKIGKILLDKFETKPIYNPFEPL